LCDCCWWHEVISLQSNHTTGGPAQAKLCCYDGWLRPQVCKKEKGYIDITNNLPCINKGINNAMSGSNNSQTFLNKYLSFHSHPIFILSIYLPNSMEWRQCRAWKAASMAATAKLTWRW
jgi:hypothetical protein